MINKIKNIPKGWVKYKLGELGEFKTSSVDKKINKDENEVNLINYMDVYKNRFIESSMNFMKVTANEHEQNVSQVKKGDILFTPSSETPDDIGHSAVVYEELPNTLQSYHLVRLRIEKKHNICLKFRGYLCNSRNTLKYFETLSTGVTRYTLSKKDFEKAEVIFPKAVKEQAEIADILLKADRDIKKTEEVIKKSEILKKGLITDLFSNGIGHKNFTSTELGKIPVKWKIKKMENISRIIDSLHQTPKFSETGYAMVRVSDIKTGELNLNKTLKVNEEVYKQFTINYTPQKGDIVLSRVGSYGVSSFVSTNKPFCMGQNTVVINPKINNKFLFYVLNSEKIKKQIELESVGLGYKSLSLKGIKNLKFGVPDSKEQQQIAEILSSVDNKININKKIKNKLTKLKEGLMQDLLSGNVRVN